MDSFVTSSHKARRIGLPFRAALEERRGPSRKEVRSVHPGAVSEGGMAEYRGICLTEAVETCAELTCAKAVTATTVSEIMDS